MLQGMTQRIAIDARVSTGERTPDDQLWEVRAVAERMGRRVAEEYVDHGVGGARRRDRRPACDRLHRTIVRREIDSVMAWSVDRPGCSRQQPIGLLPDLDAEDVDLQLHQQGVDTTMPAGKAKGSKRSPTSSVSA